MSEDTAARRLNRLRNAIDLAQELATLDGPIVREWFAKREAELCREMLDAAPTDDEGRRNAAMKAWALREFRTYLRSTIDEGRRAPQEIAKLRQSHE